MENITDPFSFLIGLIALFYQRLPQILHPEIIRYHMPIYSAAIAGIIFNIDAFFRPKNYKSKLPYWISDRMAKLNIIYWSILLACTFGVLFLYLLSLLTGSSFASFLDSPITKLFVIQQSLWLLIQCLAAYWICRWAFVYMFAIVFVPWCMWETHSIFITATLGLATLAAVVLLVGSPFLIYWLWQRIYRSYIPKSKDRDKL